mgnify:FL=1
MSQSEKILLKAFEAHAETDRQAFEKINDTLARLEETLRKQDAVLQPISETYRSVSKVGKWAMALIVFLSIVVGTLLGLKNLFSLK